LLDYESASDCYERANNLRFEAAIANQIASVYRALGRYRDASRQADRAILLYERMRDRSHLAIAKDTKALILMDEGKHTGAKQHATQAIDLLRHHDPAWVTIPLVTRAKILCRMHQYA